MTDQATRSTSARRWLIAALFVFAFTMSITRAASASLTDDGFLNPDQAFVFSARLRDPQTVEVRYRIADGYYMYRERFAFKADHGVQLGKADIPPGKVKFDENFDKDVETYRGDLVLTVPIAAGPAGPFTFTATSQGCADKGLCYPPRPQSVELIHGAATTVGTTANARPAAPSDGSGSIETALRSGSLLAVMPLFFMLGLLLSFTPCVLPMIPILSSIIVGRSLQSDGKSAAISKSRGFGLALAYSLGMAIIYTAMGVAAGLAGEGLAAALQKPWVLISFAGLLVALSLSMFGFYELQLPNALQSRLAGAANQQRSGNHFGVFVMGAISALIVGPCVAAPLAGALVYISQTRNVLIGGSALFAMAMGMSVPLLLVGVSAGSLLPRAGGWMTHVKQFFGVLLIGVALWMVSPVVPTWLEMLAWGVLLIVCAVYLQVFDPLPAQASGWMRLWKGIGVVLMVIGMLQLIGLATGGRDILQPLEKLSGKSTVAVTHQANWQKVTTVAELDAAIRNAQGKPVLLDFWAEWCVSCKEMERFTFSDPQVAARMERMVLLKADVTQNSLDDQALMKRFSLFGPPGIILFDASGQELQSARVIGFMKAEPFAARLPI